MRRKKRYEVNKRRKRKDRTHEEEEELEGGIVETKVRMTLRREEEKEG